MNSSERFNARVAALTDWRLWAGTDGIQQFEASLNSGIHGTSRLKCVTVFKAQKSAYGNELHATIYKPYVLQSESHACIPVATQAQSESNVTLVRPWLIRLPPQPFWSQTRLLP